MPCFLLFRKNRVTCGKNLQDSRELSFNFQNILDAATDEGSTYNSSVTSFVPHPPVFSFFFSVFNGLSLSFKLEIL